MSAETDQATATLSPPARQPGPVRANATPAASAPAAPAAAPEAPGPNPAVLAVWLYQMTLVLVALAAFGAMVAARWSERSWLNSVFCGCVAATLTGFLGTFLANVLFGTLLSGPQKSR